MCAATSSADAGAVRETHDPGADNAHVAGDPLRSVGLLRDRIDNPGTCQAPGARAQLLATYASRSRTLDLPVDATALLAEAERIVSDDEGPRRLSVLVARLQDLVDHGEWQQASELADRAAALAQGLDHREALTEIRVVMTKVIEAMDDLDAAERHVSAILAASRPEDPVTLRLLHQLASFSHRRGDLLGSLARFDEGVRVAKATRREWAPWGLECRLTGGLVAYELGDWADAADRLDVQGAAVAQPGRALFEAARLAVSAGRGEPIDPATIYALRQWWTVDGLSTVFTATAGIDLLGDAGDAELLRLRWSAGAADQPTAAEMVTAWASSVAAFREYGHVFETARSTARLAEAQRAGRGHRGEPSQCRCRGRGREPPRCPPVARRACRVAADPQRRRRGSGPHRPRTRGPRLARTWAEQRADRQSPVHQHQDRERPRVAPARQARGRQPHRGGSRCAGPRSAGVSHPRFGPPSVLSLVSASAGAPRLDPTRAHGIPSLSNRRGLTRGPNPVAA